MGKVVAAFTMSLDGFIAGPQDEVDQLFRWYYSGDTEFPVAGGQMVFKVSRASAEVMQANWSQIGVIVTGRRDFDVSHAWGGHPPVGERVFIVTHNPPQEWIKDGSPFTFVTEGVERAIELAQAAAGERTIAISGTQITQQALRAGLVDEIHIDLAHLLLGKGIRLFDQLGPDPIDLACTSVIEGIGVTHIHFCVLTR